MIKTVGNIIIRTGRMYPIAYDFEYAINISHRLRRRTYLVVVKSWQRRM